MASLMFAGRWLVFRDTAKPKASAPPSVSRDEPTQPTVIESGDDNVVSITDSLDQNPERIFRSVFAIMPESRREDLISHYRRQHNCDRIEAMKFAVKDQQDDNQRYR